MEVSAAVNASALPPEDRDALRRARSLARIKKWRELRRDLWLATQRRYYAAHRDAILAKRKQRH